MPKGYSVKLVIKVLECQGFVFTVQRGSHAKYRRTTASGILTVIVPMHGGDIPHGTFRSILRQSHLQREDFEDEA